MRLSEEKRANVVTSLRANEHGDKPDYAGYPLRATALDLADELAAMREEAETQFMANADVIRNHEQTRKELAAMTDAWVGAELREESLKYTVKRLKRQVELMGWLIGSHEADICELGEYAVSQGSPSFDQMGDPSDEGEYTDDDLDMLKDHWSAAREELLRRQMAADNHDHRDDAARQAWEESR